MAISLFAVAFAVGLLFLSHVDDTADDASAEGDVAHVDGVDGTADGVDGIGNGVDIAVDENDGVDGVVEVAVDVVAAIHSQLLLAM